MEIRSSIIALLIIAILIVICLKRGLPQLLASKIFFGFLVVCFLCNLCEIFEGIVFNNLEETSSMLKRASQNLYAGTLVLAALVMCLYVYAKTTYKAWISPLRRLKSTFVKAFTPGKLIEMFFIESKTSLSIFLSHYLFSLFFLIQ